MTKFVFHSKHFVNEIATSAQMKWLSFSSPRSARGKTIKNVLKNGDGNFFVCGPFPFEDFFFTQKYGNLKHIF